MIIHCRVLVGAVLASLLLAPVANAGPTTDFSTLGTNNTSLGTTQTTGNGIVISAFYGSGTTFTTTANLWDRQDGLSDDGLGVCSSGETNCSTGGGDVNELSNEKNVEWIVLTRPANLEWTGIWLSSLDNNGGSPNEQGTIYWSNTLSITGASSFGYQAGVFGADAYGDILPSIGLAFDPFANYLMFRAGPDGQSAGTDHNNDYLLWGVTTVTCTTDICPHTRNLPEPFTLSLFGAGLAGMVAYRRRKRPFA